jgi:adenylate kinase
MAAPVIIILGPPGSGKGTQSALLAQALDAVHLSSGQILRSVSSDKVLRDMSTGRLVVEDDLITALAQALSAIPENQMIILDGVGRKKAEVEWLIRELGQQQRSIKKVIHLIVSQAESLRRNLPRKRLEDRPEAQEERWKEYQRHMLNNMDFYRQAGVLVEVDGVGSIEDVSERIMKVIS